MLNTTLEHKCAPFIPNTCSTSNTNVEHDLVTSHLTRHRINLQHKCKTICLLSLYNFHTANTLRIQTHTHTNTHKEEYMSEYPSASSNHVHIVQSLRSFKANKAIDTTQRDRSTPPGLLKYKVRVMQYMSTQSDRSCKFITSSELLVMTLQYYVHSCPQRLFVVQLIFRPGHAVVN